MIGTVSANQTTFDATGLSPGGTDYAFSVAPTNSTSASAVAYNEQLTTNQPPTIVTGPSTGANPVTTTSTTLSVQGADDGGQSNLTYTWSIISSPNDAGGYFSVNDSNAAKNTTVTFYAAGDYTFQVAITDALGLQVQGTVEVFVQHTQTSATVSPARQAIVPGGSASFTATALDQFGNAMRPQQPFTWSLGGTGDMVSWGSSSQYANYTAPPDGGSQSLSVNASSGGAAATANLAVDDYYGGDLGQQTLLGLTVSDNSCNNTVTAITNGDVQTMTLAGIPAAGDPTTLSASVCVGPGFSLTTDTNSVYVSIERQAGSQILFYGQASQYNQADWTLTTSGQAVDFVIKEWFDSGSDSREVDVKVVTPWTAVGTWATGQKSLVQANADGASLLQLARDITGNAGDALHLGRFRQIEKGEQIDVTPLLNCLEQALRDNVVAAANAPKAASFGTPDNLSERPNPHESYVDSIFGIGTPPNPTPKFDCAMMANWVMARGVIATIDPNPGDNLYTQMGSCPFDFGMDKGGNVGSYFTVYNPPLPLAALKPGDWVVFWNYYKYRAFHEHGDWKTENVIMTGTDWFWGFEGSGASGGDSGTSEWWR